MEYNHSQQYLVWSKHVRESDIFHVLQQFTVNAVAGKVQLYCGILVQTM